MPRLMLLITCLLAGVQLAGQSLRLSPTDISLEFQVYPTGFLPGIRIDQNFGKHHALHLRGGLNLINHRDLGVQDDERGSGYGGTFGYRYYFPSDFQGWFLGLRADVWRNTIEWKNFSDLPGAGTTRLWVLQPTLEGGYLFLLANQTWFISPSLGFGVEVNVVTEGAETGQGLILLLGCSSGIRF
ncbi:MAG: DUF3575 domain-containing protein [Phaeodactylibacter sp.]|nr:DUF3575 domain-containing protein [Phaeodactylibacter sp.]